MPTDGIRDSGNFRSAVSKKGMASKGRKRSKKGHPEKATVVTQEVLQAEREDLISQKRQQLHTVVDRHDTLVREMFHMDHFKMMVKYDPAIAKTDNTKVFQNYKSSLYSLVDEPVAGPSRTTRRTRTEQQQLAQPVSISAPLPTPPSRASPAKKQFRAKAPISTKLVSLDTAKSHAQKPKAPQFSVFDDEPRVDQPLPSILVRRSSRKQEEEEIVSHPRKKRRLSEHNSLEGISTESRRGVSLKGHENKVIEPNGHVVPERHVSTKLRKQAEHEQARVSAPPQMPKLAIKRIKLVVRRPPPPLTNPKQRPPPAEFGSSVDAFLKSYFTFNGQDVDETTLEGQVKADASILERADRLKSSGSLLLSTEALQLNKEDIKDKSQALLRQSKDHWDNVVDAACIAGKVWRRKSGQQIAAQCAKAVRGYWDGQVSMKERAKAQEERRLRALAKTTIRMVTDEWKKAVFHIREQERLKQEAEEVRRGREHLDAILDQSGQLLETQQGDLKRGEYPLSRSSSISLTYRGWGSDESEDDEDQNDEASEEDEATHGDDVNQGDDANEGFDVEDGDDEEVIDELEEKEDETSSIHDEDVATQSPTLLGSTQNLNDTESQFADDELLARMSSATEVEGLSILPFPSNTSDHEQDGTPSQSISTSLPSALIPSKQISTPACLDSVQALSSSQSPSLLDRDTDAEQPSTPTLPGLATNPDDGMILNQRSPREDGEEDIFKTQSPSPHPSDLPSEKGQDDDTSGGLLSGTQENDEAYSVPEYLKSFAVARVEWNNDNKILSPLLLRGNLRPYQQSGLEWLVSLHSNNLNGILADEMGLGKTIQTIALLAHLACDRGIWGPHLIIVPTSVLLNWEMEFKKFLPGFKVMSYHGGQKRRKELRQGWNDKYHFNVCITSYTLASRDAHIFKRKAWYYLILDEAHMIKNFKSQRWNILLMFRSFRRLLLTGTPLQNNLTELWALLQFLMSGSNFATLKDFGDWFSNPVEKAIEMGNADDDDTMQRVTKLHTVLRPYLLRRLKRDVEKELPSKYEHLVICPLSKRQRFLYDEFMARAQTRDALQSGVYQKIANILMQLRKVCNHPDLFEVRPIVTSFIMQRSALAEFEIQELLVRRRLLQDADETINLSLLGLRFVNDQDVPSLAMTSIRHLDATSRLPFASEALGEAPSADFRTIAGYRKYSAYMERARMVAKWSHIGYVNRLRCRAQPLYGSDKLAIAAKFYEPILPVPVFDDRRPNWESIRIVNSMVKSYTQRAEDSSDMIDKFAVVTPAVVALELPRFILAGYQPALADLPLAFDNVLHQASVKLQIAFPDPLLLQYDCGKLQELARLLREKKAGGHRVLIFTQMTRILDILEIFLNFHGYLYLRLDGATKIEDRQYITERFNADPRVFCFIASSRSGGVGINLTGADTVVFYDSDFNPQMDKQCEDRAHRIGQIRDVHIYRFVSQHTVEEALLRKANQKRSLDDLVIQKGEFDWRSLFNDQSALSKALEEFEDTEDVHAAEVAATEEVALQGADEADFGGEIVETSTSQDIGNVSAVVDSADSAPNEVFDMEEYEGEGGTIVDYMISFVDRELEFFKDWRL